MRKLAPAILAALALGVAVEAQTRCRNNTAWCIGSKDTDVIIGGNVYNNSPDGGLTLGTGTFSGTVSTLKANIIDAGSLLVVGTAQFGGTTPVFKADVLDAGVANFQGQVQMNSPIHFGADAFGGTIALSSGSPSTATKTVLSGSTCFCWPVGNTAAIAAGGCAASVSSTTATFTGPNTVTTTVGYICSK